MNEEDFQYKEAAARIRAAHYRFMAQQQSTTAAAYRFAAAMQRFGETIQNGTDREIVEHPDLAEVNVFLDGYYEP